MMIPTRALFAGLCLLVVTLASSNLRAEDAAPAPVQVNMQTSLGLIALELYPEYAPLTVQNFVEYATAGFYDGTIYHRVIPDFMIQGGGFDAQLAQRKTRDPIRNEANNGLKNMRGTIAMARTNQVDSATAQFFINLKDNRFLDHGARNFGYAVFGRVVGGMDIVDRIARTPTTRAGMHQNVPVDAVIIESVKIIAGEPEASPAAAE